MKRLLCLSAILAAASSVVVAACSHPTSPGGTPFDPGLCARFSACFGSEGLSFGQNCELFQIIQQSPGLVSKDSQGAVELSQVTCLENAADCTAMKACGQASAAQAATCGVSTISHCDGNVLVYCDVTPPTIADCAAAGQVCIQGTSSGACGTAPCNASTMPSCNGDALVHCNDGALQTTDCTEGISSDCSASSDGGASCSSHVANTCGVVGGTAQCTGSGAACDDTTFQNTCDGTTVVTCTGGKIGRFDCASYGVPVTCRVGSDGSANCAGVATQCDENTPESCSNGVITYCMWGNVTTLDCKQYGLSGCTTATSGQPAQTSAACTP